MRLHSVTLRQKLGKLELADYFYDRVLELPGRAGMGGKALRWYDAPVHLAVQEIAWGEDPMSMEGFTGVQLNVMPRAAVDALAATLAETGQKVAPPRDVGDIRLTQIRDASGNVLMILGRDERPDEPLLGEGVGSLSLFVHNLDTARRFYVDTLGLGVRARPHPGMLVLCETGTPLMLYAAEANTQATPMGRRTHIALADEDVEAVLARIDGGPGRVLDRATAPFGESGEERVVAATIADPDDNELVLFAEAHLTLPAPPAGDAPT
jgi:catechol 2,3-dioxygenase-like lactoylglutathione lyase family enzyme